MHKKTNSGKIVIIITIFFFMKDTQKNNSQDIKNLESSLDSLLNNKQLLSNSYDFLNQQIDRIKENDDNLTTPEELEYLRKLTSQHLELSLLEQKYQANKKDLTVGWKEKIKLLIEHFSTWRLSIEDLNFLNQQYLFEKEKTIETLPFWRKSYRDFVETNINIKSYIPETIYENEMVKLFYTQFTIEYLNILEQNLNNDYSIIEEIKNEEKWFKLSKNQTFEILRKVFNKFKKEFKDFNYQLEIKISEDLILLCNKEKVLKKIEPHIPLIEAENKKNIIGNSYWEHISILLSEYIETQWLKPETKKILIILIDKYFIWENVKINWEIKITKDFLEKNREDILSNFKIFMNFILHIESSWWKNISNLNNSWAEWYYQFKDNNDSLWYEIMINWVYIELEDINEWKRVKKSLWDSKKTTLVVNINGNSKEVTVSKCNIRYKPSSIEMAVKRAKIFYWENQPKWLQGITTNQDWKITKQQFDIKDYWHEEQTLLWTIDLFERWESTTEYLTHTLLWSQFHARELYTKIHHTQISEDDPLVLDKLKKIISKLKILI